MRPYRAVLLALFVVGGVLVAAVPAGATADAGVGAHVHALDAERTGLPDARPAAAANDTTDNSSTGNSSLGADISSFMQSSAAEVGGAVETGMWTAAFNATENQSRRVALVERRTGELRSRLADLERRKAELVAEREAGNVSETAYKAKVSNLIGRIDALESAIDAVSKRAERVNAEVETLETLRTETENLTGPAIAAVARNVTGVGDGRHGPPVGVRTTGDGHRAENGATDAGQQGPAGQRTSADRPGPQGDRSTTAGGAETEAAVEPSNDVTPATPPVADDDSTATLFGAAPPTGLAERVGSAVDAATAALDRAASAIPA